MTTDSIEHLYITIKRLERVAHQKGGGIHLNSYQTRSLIDWIVDNVLLSDTILDIAEKDYQEGEEKLY